MIGGKLGRYEILEVLGQGGQSIAYKARDPRINRIVAVKQILSKKGLPEQERADFLTRFMREAEAAGRLSHPNIATIYDVGGYEDGEPWIAMEYVDGCDLDDLLQREHPLEQTRVIKLFVQLCSALDYAHDAGVVHRDIKPGNIMVTRSDSVKVVDFGIAKMDSSSLTQAGMVMGTPNYMSPEQIMGKPLDRRSDIFSLGVVLYETLTGEKPFAGEHWTTVSFKIVHQPHAPLLSCNSGPTLLPELGSIVDKALAKAPADRYQTCAEFAEVLELLLSGEHLGFAPAIGRSPPPASPAAIESLAASSPARPGPGDAVEPSPRATVNLQSGQSYGNARGLHGDDSTAITPGALPTIAVAADAPPPGSTPALTGEPAGRAAPAVHAEGTASPILPYSAPAPNWSFTISKVSPASGLPREAFAPAPPVRKGATPSKRRDWMLRLAAVAAIIAVAVFVVLSRIPREASPVPPIAAATAAPVLPGATAPAPAAADPLRNARAALQQGLLVGRDGRDALHFVREALAIDPGSAEARAFEADVRARALQQADDLRKRGRADEAQDAWDLLLEGFPADPEIRKKHDAAQTTRSRTQLATELERSRIAGEKAFAAGNHAEAVTQFGKLTRADSKNASAFYALGRANLGQGNLAEAEKNLSQACALEPGNPTYNIQLSGVLERNKKLTAAIGYLEKGIELGGDRENSVASLKSRASELKFRIDLGQLTPHTFLSKHVHRFGGRCDGQIIVTESGISFVPDKEKDHAIKASWEGVKTFAVLKDRLEIELSGGKKASFECAELDRLARIAAVIASHR